MDAEDALLRERREGEKTRDKYRECKQELKRVCQEMENYGTILEALEKNVEKSERERRKIEKECEEARQQVKIIR